jgi:cytochrome c peroxidase
MVSDRMIDFPNFTTLENNGKNIFMTNTKVNCFSCHNTDAFITDNPRNNGISIDNSDQGIFVHTGKFNDMGKFKSPSLKECGTTCSFHA